MRTPTYYRTRAIVRLTVWTALAVAGLWALQQLLWLAWVGLGR